MEEKPTQKKLRLHYIDWLRLLLVMGVVYAHTAKSGVSGTGGVNEAWLIDDRTLIHHSSYRTLLDLSKKAASAPMAVRWISIVRQWCLPVLFWVSGAAIACSYKGGVPRGVPKLFAFAIAGMLLNAALWFLGPLDDQCYVGNPDCAHKGLVFNFTIVLWAGAAFAILFQMWYCIALGCMIFLNWPLMAAVCGYTSRVWTLPVQWVLNMALYLALVLGSGACPQPVTVLLALAITEAAFLFLCALDSPNLRVERPLWLPLRIVHYLLAAIVLVQFAALPYADRIDSIGLPYLSYMITGFNRFFDLGLVMTRARLRPTGDEVEGVVSRIWPVMLIVGTVVAPSTNWDSAGLLTYPYFRLELDRCLYVAGALVVTFVLDRVSRGLECDRLPSGLMKASLILYLCHPVFITLLLWAGLRSISIVWLLSVLLSVFIVYGPRIICRFFKKEADSNTLHCFP